MQAEAADSEAGGDPTVLFYEPTHTGHHLPYLARMLPGFLRLPLKAVLATTPEAVSSEEYRLSLAPFGDRLELCEECVPRGRSSDLAYAWRRFWEARRLAHKLQPEHLCVMYGHGIWQIWAMLRLLGVRLAPSQTVVELWEYRGGFSYPDANGLGDRVKRWLLRSLLRSGQLQVLQCDDEYLYEYAGCVAGGATEVKLTPNPIKFRDPVEKDEARRTLGIDHAGRYLGCAGMVTRTKGCDLAVRAFAQMAEDVGQASADCRLLLAGPHSDEIKSLLEEAPYRGMVEQGRIVSLDRFLNEDEMFLAAASSDIVLAPYPNHSGRSSIILWAAAAGRPVLAVNRGCIQRVVEQERLGETTVVRDTQAFSQAMRRSLAAPWSAEDVQRVRDYAAWHRIENYQELSSASVREQLARARNGG